MIKFKEITEENVNQFIAAMTRHPDAYIVPMANGIQIRGPEKIKTSSLAFYCEFVDAFLTQENMEIRNAKGDILGVIPQEPQYMVNFDVVEDWYVEEILRSTFPYLYFSKWREPPVSIAGLLSNLFPHDESELIF